MKKLCTVLAFTLLLLAGCSQGTNQASAPSASAEIAPASTQEVSASVAEISQSADKEDLEGNEDLRIRMTFDGGEAIVRLEDNAAARDWVSQLPMTQAFEDFNSIEKICRLPEELITEGVEFGVDPEIANVTLYVPWNTLVFYYEDYGWNDDLIPMGHIETGMDLLAARGNEFTVTMEPMTEAIRGSNAGSAQSDVTTWTQKIGK